MLLATIIIQSIFYIQETLYMQILRWFQNNSYSIRKACGHVSKYENGKKKSSHQYGDTEDNESTKRHLHELDNEWSRTRGRSPDKLVRLLSLTFHHRHAKLLETGIVSRVGTALQDFPMMMKPLYVSDYYNFYKNKLNVLLLYSNVACPRPLSYPKSHISNFE